ncbi:MAG: beta-glucosidase [Oceanicoccus sp.]|jgi:beta-glucosidase
MSNSPLKTDTIQSKVDSLLERMSLAQKIGQMTQAERMSISPDQVKEYHIGSILSGAGSCPNDNTLADWVTLNDSYWVASMAEDDEHLAIPIIYGVDAIHGNNNVEGATIFPHNIGLGATNNPELLQKIAVVTAREILAAGVDWTFAPNLAVARDDRWGRTYESYSQKPEIVGSYSANIVKGLQGDLGRDSVVACVKHWVGDGGTRHGVDQGDTVVSEEELERIHMGVYYPAIAAGALTVMCSYSSWRGEKCHGHHYLLTEVLKDRMQFGGYVISDWDGIDYLSDYYYDAIAAGVNAGIDMFMISENWRPFIEHLTHHVERGTVAVARIDDAVRRILSVKFAFGLFDKPRPAERYWSNHASFSAKEHRELARDAVRQSLVLLKNSEQLLPLDRSKTILVAGKSAHNKGNQCGGFTITWQGLSGNDHIVGGTSVWEGIQAVAPNAVLSIEAGAEADPAKHDVAIVVVGETPYAEGMGDIRDGDDAVIEAGSQINGSLRVMEAYGGSLALAELHPEDLATIKTITAKGVAVVVVLISGRPLLIDREINAATAFVAAWLPGSEGQGIADVLFGDYGFGAKLSFTWPRSPSAESSGVCTKSVDETPLFPYGFGLRYSKDN